MKTIYYGVLLTIGVGFAIFFFVTLGPILLENPNIVEAFRAGYVNPYSSGFSTDAIACWLVLAVWVIYDKVQNGMKWGWITLLIGIVPGVATGFALYLFLRSYQLKDPEF